MVKITRFFSYVNNENRNLARLYVFVSCLRLGLPSDPNHKLSIEDDDELAYHGFYQMLKIVRLMHPAHREADIFSLVKILSQFTHYPNIKCRVHTNSISKLAAIGCHFLEVKRIYRRVRIH